MIGKLTNRKIVATIKKKPANKVVWVNDGDGLYLHIGVRGKASWVLRYTNIKTKKKRNMGLGSYPSVSIESARHSKNRAKYLNYKGIDPIEDRNLDSNRVKVGAIFKKWCEQSKANKKSFAKMKITMEKYLISEIEDIKISDVTAVLITNILLRVEREYKIFSTVKKILMYFNQMMNFAVNYGYLSANPCIKVANCLSSTKGTHLPSIHYNDVGKLIKTLADVNIQDRSLFLLIWSLLTIVRPNEASGAKWSEIDEKKKVWTIPADRMKMQKEHRVPLTDSMLKLLKKLRTITGDNEYLFPQSKNKNRPMSSQTINQILKRNGYKGILVSHGFRAIACTYFYDNGYDPEVIEACLAHVTGNRTVQAYNRTDFFKLRFKLMSHWSSFLESKFTKLPSITSVIYSSSET